MKKTKLFSLLLLVASVMGVLSSCNSGSNSDYIIEQRLTNFINVTNDYTTGQVAFNSGIGYVLQLNFTKQTATITIEGMKLPNGTSYGQLVFANLPFTMNTTGWVEIKQPMAIPTTSAGLQAPTFSSFNFRTLDRVLDGNVYYPLFDISYGVEGYQITSLPPNVINQGTTVVSTAGQPDYIPGSDTPILYGISFDTKTMKAAITIQGAKFAQAMPAMNMGFKDVPFEFTQSGMVSLKADALEPVLITGANATTPMPNYPITNLTCLTDDKNNMNLNFTCTVKSDRGGVTTETPYKVTVTCSTPTSNSTQK